MLEALYESLLNNVRVKVKYKGQGQAEREYELNPLGLVFNDPVAYLVATCWDYTDPLLFALHRFLSAELLAFDATRPEGFDLQNYIDSGALGFCPSLPTKVFFKARFEQAAADHLRESPLSSEQIISNDKDGWVSLEAEVRDNQQLRWWLLGFGPQVEVLEPAALRREMADQIEKMADLYGQEKKQKSAL